MDFVTAFGRLLCDGQLRDAFATQPQKVVAELGLQESERETLAALDIDDLEAQAETLLRKRLDKVKAIAPRTVSALGEKGRASFLRRARDHRPENSNQEFKDALMFCSFDGMGDARSICPNEWNRIQFALGQRRIAVHCFNSFWIRGKARTGLQLFIRRNVTRWDEYVIFLGL